MKKPIFNLRSFFILCAFVLACSTLRTQAQFPIGSYTNDFATAGNTNPFTGGSVASWITWYNTPGGGAAMTNDPTEGGNYKPDPFAPSGSGALRVNNPFAGVPGTQNVFFGTFDNEYGYDFSTEVNLAEFDTINFDVYVGPQQAGLTDGTGDYGTLYAGIINSGYGDQSFGSVTIPGIASNQWVHLSVPIDHTQNNETAVPGITFGYNNYGGYPETNINFWLGNLVMHYDGLPPAAPTMSGEVAVPGLDVEDTSTGQYDRQEIQSATTTGNSWVGHSPVTYSFTITNWPSAANGLEAYLFLIGAPAQWPEPGYDEAADYNESNVLIFSVQGTQTSAQGHVNYKVGEGGGNAMIYGNAPYTNAPGTGSTNFGSGAFGQVNSSTVFGTWSLTFTDDTNLLLTCPDGSTTNFTITEYDAQAFKDSTGVGVMLGSQPNASGDIGKKVVYSSIDITGDADPVDDNFMADSTLNPEWLALDTGAGDALLVPTNTALFVDWTVPDAGYSLQSKSALTNSQWFAVNLPTIGPLGGLRKVMVPFSSLANPNHTYFSLIQRVYSQLQVLLPGQTNNPSLPNGYGGTIDPTQVFPGAIVNVTINAVDAGYNLVNVGGDNIDVTTSDEDDDIGGTDGVVVLANGTTTIQIEFNDASPDTITATDTTTGGITPGTQTFTP